MSLFKCERFTSHSGLELDFKIDCDYLTDSDIECIAKIIAKKTRFGHVYGIPSGGTRLAEALEPYIDPHSNTLLIVDDVLTTGRSMEEAKKHFEMLKKYFETLKYEVAGWVIFARRKPPEWVNAVFVLSEVIE